MSFDRRFLAGVAVALVMVAAVLGVFVVLPGMLTDAGIRVDWGLVAGLIVNLLVAVGTFSAAGAAVWVATTDRRLRKTERDAERDAAGEAQAGLVLAQPFQVAAGNPGLGTVVQNYRSLSILR